MDDDDEFWRIALEDPDEFFSKPMTDDEEDDWDEARQLMTRFDLPYNEDTPVVSVYLSDLPPSEGVWSPLGAKPWYGSALLSMLLLEKGLVYDFLKSKETISVLELGSGAVGVATTATALLLSQIPGNHRLIASDNDASVVENLDMNLHRFEKRILEQYPSIRLPELETMILDWNKPEHNGTYDFIFGSELVYTPENGEACAKCILHLLQQNPKAMVLIVQVTDRDGWSNVFLPSLDGCVVKEQIVDAELDAKAQSLIVSGGVLDRFSFGICYIQRKDR